MQDPQISVVIAAHRETSWLVRAIRSFILQNEPPPFEIIPVCDRIGGDTAAALCEAIQEAPAGLKIRPITVDFGDLGESRNAGVKEARGRFIAFCDGDDGMGCLWLRQAFEYARRFDHDNFALHQQWSIMFGAVHFVHRHYGTNDPEFSPKDVIQYNPVSALAFGPKTLFERFPYRRMDPPAAYEDWHWFTETLGAGVEHHVVPSSVEFVRMKLNQNSLAARMKVRKGSLMRQPLFDRRSLPEAQREPLLHGIPDEIHKQTHFFHHRVGEFRCQIDPQAELRAYPRQKIFNEQAWLRDQIGDSKHVVLVHELKPGGAEKYGIDWAVALKSLGEDVALIETAPGASPWAARADAAVKTIHWHRRTPLEGPEIPYALQRALIQCELQSLFVCNAELGWVLARENPAALAKRVICASFSTFPLPTGYVSCPPFYLDENLASLTILTDNDRHAERLRGYGIPGVAVLPPRASYGGPSKLKQTGDRRRILWAGRGSHEKGPHLPALIAATMPDIDMHIWGDVPLMLHALPNLHYRGPFESFEAIDGAYDAYLLTSSHEGMPNTALEAVLAGLPVIASDVGDVRKIAGAIFPAPGQNQQKNVDQACRAIAGFFAERSRYEHGPAEAIVNGWRDEFAARVKELVT